MDVCNEVPSKVKVKELPIKKIVEDSADSANLSPRAKMNRMLDKILKLCKERQKKELLAGIEELLEVMPPRSTVVNTAQRNLRTETEAMQQYLQSTAPSHRAFIKREARKQCTSSSEMIEQFQAVIEAFKNEPLSKKRESSPMRIIKVPSFLESTERGMAVVEAQRFAPGI